MWAADLRTVTDIRGESISTTMGQQNFVIYRVYVNQTAESLLYVVAIATVKYARVIYRVDSSLREGKISGLSLEAVKNNIENLNDDHVDAQKTTNYIKLTYRV